MKIKNVRSWVAEPNTPESDLKEFVTHVVKFESVDDDKTHEVRLRATDPMDAIDRVHAMAANAIKIYEELDRDE